MPTVPIRNETRDAAFFVALENGHPVRAACKAAGYTRQVVYRWRRRDPEFDARWREALAIAADLLEEEADRRGRDGFDEPVFFQGAQCGAKRKYSDALLLARLKAVRPELYRERITMPGIGEQKVTVVIRDFDAEDAIFRLVAENKLKETELPLWLRQRLAQAEK